MMLQILVDGLVTASYIMLGVVGLSLVYNILNFPNFSQGDYFASGAYFALGVVGLFGTAGSVLGLSFGWPVITGALCAALLTAVVAIAIDRAVYRPLRRRKASRVTLIMASFGVALMIRHMIVVAAGHDPWYYSFTIQPALRLGPVRITPNELIAVAVTAVLVVAVHLFLTRTTLGKSMRAVSEDPSLARVNGIDVDRVVMWTWIIGAMLTATGGVLFGISVQLHPYMGFELLLPMFAALIVGGLTNLYGAVLGALVIGLMEGFTVHVLAPEYRQGIGFLAILAILMVRPHGLVGERA